MTAREKLSRLARSYGVQTSYVDMSGRRRFASSKSLQLVLQSLETDRNRRTQPVRVAWDQRPFGYHRVGETLVISAPRKCFQRKGRDWGLFLPLYALHSARNRGAGDLTDLKAFARWAGRLGADWVGTLPLLSQFLDKPFEPSPYAPVSRLFWSEFWLDVGPVKGLPRGPRVDYRRQMAAKWRILERKAKGWNPPKRWLRERPEAEEYAGFRGSRTHLYAQWLADRQMEGLRRSCAQAGVGLYFDLPLGVHPEGYDAWKEREIFVEGMHVGAPPDPFFRQGQDWGFRPMHPEKIREQGYDYFIRCVRHSMRYASMLRVDHIMGLHRLFWVPRGCPAGEGVYVRYRAEELYAILSLESHRNRCAVVGEDLGTVPAEVRRSMRRRGMAGMFVVQYEWRSDTRRPLRSAPPGSMAALNTHDMPPFATFWRGGKDQNGEPDAAAVAAATLRALAKGPARSVLVNPEDLWGERRPHNVPGTVRRRTNWTRKMRFSLEEMSEDPLTRATLRQISALRCRS